jgi:antitoxin component YwqK of YwqJK toxin-antitoxin module
MNDLKVTTYPNEEKSYTYDLFNNKSCVRHYENGKKTKEESYKNDLLDGPTVSFTWYQDGETI